MQKNIQVKNDKNNFQKNLKIMVEGLLQSGATNTADLMRVKRKLAKSLGMPLPDNSQLLKGLRESDLKNKSKDFLLIERLLRKRSIRTMSGIAPVAVLTEAYPCPGNCVFCPTEKDVPQSYLSNEPAVMRAIRCSYDPYIQVQDRLRALIGNGHKPEKIELIVIGGTWSYLPEKYKYWYIVNLYAAANDFCVESLKTKIKAKYEPSLSIFELKKALLLEQGRNEKADYRIIGLTLETRPDYINKEEVLQMRELGCTRVELGVQIVDDEVLKLNQRGNTVSDIAQATAMLRDYGFKITYHLMPGLPGSSLSLDFQRFEELFRDERFQPDQIKFYPTVVTKGSKLYDWWQEGRYKPYSDEELKSLIIGCKSVVPEYVRIIRLIRDIPGESIVAGNKITNLRQIMKQEGVTCSCIRCREAGEEASPLVTPRLKVISYRAAAGEEYFLSFVSDTDKLLYGFCRLRLSPVNVIGKGKAAIVRELHVYGELVPLGADKIIQHTGLGKKLLSEAEEIAKKNGCDKIHVISGIGVRAYYRKHGYRKQGTYMAKKIG